VAQEDVQAEKDTQMEKDCLLGESSDDHNDSKVPSKDVETVESNLRPESPNPELEFILSLQ